MDAGFVLALPFHHRDLEPDYVGFDEMGGGEAYAWDKNTSAKLCAKIVGGGGLYTRGGIFAGHYGISRCDRCIMGGWPQVLFKHFVAKLELKELQQVSHIILELMFHKQQGTWR